MLLLLDTHSFLWFIAGDSRLSEQARELIDDMDNTVLLSVGSLWEIAIKTSIGKLTLSRPYDELIPEHLQRNAIDLLPIRHKDLAVLTKLPFHHRDPFDRLIIAQAMNEEALIITKDTSFDSYQVQTLW